MAMRVLAISSWVAAGHVGLSAATPALQALGAEVIGLPTVMLSNHKAFGAVAGGATPPERLDAMLDAVKANGWLARLDAVLTGYLPSAAHVAAAERAIAAARAASPGARVVVDPVLGDDPGGLYLPAEVAAAVRDRLVPRADALTPNRFELAWLTGAEADDLAGAVAAAKRLRASADVARVIVTSPPAGPGVTGALVVDADGARLHRTPRLADVPHGTGDVFAALIAGGATPGAAVGMVAALARAGAGAAHLPIAQTAARWRAVEAIEAETIA
jgi:pyridoxine kinase